jgi:hypothetical protein
MYVRRRSTSWCSRAPWRPIRSSAACRRVTRSPLSGRRVLASLHVPRLQLLWRPGSRRLVRGTGLSPDGRVSRGSPIGRGLSRVCDVPGPHRGKRPRRTCGSRVGATGAEGWLEARRHRGDVHPEDAHRSRRHLLDCALSLGGAHILLTVPGVGGRREVTSRWFRLSRWPQARTGCVRTPGSSGGGPGRFRS